MGFSLGSFAGGAAEGLTNGLNFADKYQKLNEVARQRAARRALGNTYASGIGIGDGATPAIAAGPQPPMPGQASVPRVPDAPRNDDYSAMAAMAPPGTPQPPVANDDYAAMAASPQAPMANTSTAAQPVADASITGPAPPEGGTMDQQQLTSTITDANNTIKAISDAVKRANPNIDPETLVNAVQQHIEQMKGVRNEIKDYMVAQAEYAKHQLGEDRIKGRLTETIAKVAGANQVAETRAAAARDVGAGHDTARIQSARISADAREAAAQYAAQGGVTRAQIAADASRYSADQRYKGLVYDKTLGAYVKINDSYVGANAKVDAATAQAGGTPPDRGLKTLSAQAGAPAAPAPAAARNPGIPPEAAKALKEGVNTTFGNGQVWTKRAGVPTRVK